MTAAEPVWIDETDILALHDLLLAQHGGAGGLRDPGLLASAVARPHQQAAYGDAPDIINLATALTAGLIRNHPFVDGNKRIGCVAGILFMELNGYRFTATEHDAAEAIVGLAAGTLDQAAYTRFVRDNATATATGGTTP